MVEREESNERPDLDVDERTRRVIKVFSVSCQSLDGKNAVVGVLKNQSLQVEFECQGIDIEVLKEIFIKEE